MNGSREESLTTDDSPTLPPETTPTSSAIAETNGMKAEEAVEMVDESPSAAMNRDLAAIRATTQMLTHQVSMIMGALRVPPCQCVSCLKCIGPRILHLQPPPQPRILHGVVPRPMIMNGHPGHFLGFPPLPPGFHRPSMVVPAPALVPMIEKKETTSEKEDGSESGSSTHEQETKSETLSETPQPAEAPAPEAATPLPDPTVVKPPTRSEEAEKADQLLNTLFPGGVLNSIANVPPAFNLMANSMMQGMPAPNPGGRKSKYCTDKEKRAVAEYATMHGAANAARKFGIPPSVAAYYQRKLNKLKQNDMQMAAAVSMVMPGAMMTPPPGTAASITSIPMISGLHGSAPSTPILTTPVKTMPVVNNGSPTMAPAMPIMPPPMMADHLRFGIPSSPTILRGRGRGRPKLIGDDLDATLVEYMVKLKQSHPYGNLNAHQALEIARAYIHKKSPGLLREQGGAVELKLTWAMKLVSRIAERQKEIELGLPAGSLSNLGRAGLLQLDQVNGVNLMADMAQNILSQFNAFNGGEKEEGVTMPEISNVKELDLASLMGPQEEEESAEGSTSPTEIDLTATEIELDDDDDEPMEEDSSSFKVPNPPTMTAF